MKITKKEISPSMKMCGVMLNDNIYSRLATLATEYQVSVSSLARDMITAGVTELETQV